MSITTILIKFSIFCLVCLSSLSAMDYTWDVDGPIESDLLETIKSHAPLASKEHTIVSLASLCQLADNQVDLWLQELHSRAYFDSKVSWTLDHEQTPVALNFHINPGPIYLLRTVDIEWEGPPPFAKEEIDLGLERQKPALPALIFGAEEQLLYLMALEGYPLAKIIQRDVVADLDTQSVSVVFKVESGQPVHFGPTQISGNTTVKEAYIWQQVTWKEGKKFAPDKIQRTQENLEATGLFSSVVIKEGTELDAQGRVPLEIQLTEAKHRTLAGGIGYSTQQGLGLSGEWQHRNFGGTGERLDVKANLWTAMQTGSIQYAIPGFKHSNQDLRLILEAEHEETKGYTEMSFSFSTLLDKRINDWTFLSYGISYQQLRTSHSDNNGTFHLLKTPILFKWTTANDILDPSRGMTLNLKAVPSLQIGSPTFAYWTNTAIGTFYHPLNEAETLIFASKLTAGTILGASRREIPPSERFYSGTDSTLRGYRFMSVSPLDQKHKPIGGRSMLILSSELRWKCTEKIGLAAFYEIGNVYSDTLPNLSEEQLQSVGAGVRYNTPVGPIRFDVAVPLNRRRHVDPPCQFYMSIGQSF